MHICAVPTALQRCGSMFCPGINSGVVRMLRPMAFVFYARNTSVLLKQILNQRSINLKSWEAAPRTNLSTTNFSLLTSPVYGTKSAVGSAHKSLNDQRPINAVSRSVLRCWRVRRKTDARSTAAGTIKNPPHIAWQYIFCPDHLLIHSNEAFSGSSNVCVVRVEVTDPVFMTCPVFALM